MNHPPVPEPDQVLLNTNNAVVWGATVRALVDEAKATKGNLRLHDALLVLIFERWERGILNKTERDALVDRLYT